MLPYIESRRTSSGPPAEVLTAGKKFSPGADPIKGLLRAIKGYSSGGFFLRNAFAKLILCCGIRIEVCEIWREIIN